MPASVRVLGLVAMMFVCNAYAVERPPPPSSEMLEFLGTFETAGGKAVDPVELTGYSRVEKTASKTRAKGKKTVTAKNKRKGKRI